MRRAALEASAASRPRAEVLETFRLADALKLRERGCSPITRLS